QRVSAEHDAALHLRAEPAGARLFHVLPHGAARTIAEAVLHAVVPGEVCARLAGRDEVVDRERVLGAGERDVAVNRAAKILERLERLFDALTHARLHAFDKVLARDANAGALDVASEVVPEVRLRLRVGRAVAGIVPGDAV